MGTKNLSETTNISIVNRQSMAKNKINHVPFGSLELNFILIIVT
jgi:hypothetical protein